MGQCENVLVVTDVFTKYTVAVPTRKQEALTVVLVMTDVFTKYTVAVPTRKQDALTVTVALVMIDVFTDVFKYTVAVLTRKQEAVTVARLGRIQDLSLIVEREPRSTFITRHGGSSSHRIRVVILHDQISLVSTFYGDVMNETPVPTTKTTSKL